MTKPVSPQDAARRERLSAALRENLKRRKAQAKSRAGAHAAGQDATDDAEGGGTSDESDDVRGDS